MNYQQTVDYLYNRLPMFSRIGAAAYKEDLHNTLALLDAIGNPQQQLKCIHVAGTNGKGSTSHMLAAVLQNCGYRTGLYTSPHLFDFRERIKINGEMIDADFVVDFVAKVQPQIELIEPSFFELTVALCFAWFAHQQVDVAVIETGLGGRLDSTNVIHPLLSIITNIGWDHMNLLGDTLPKIAFEKAGIIKKNVPVVVGGTNAETMPIFLAKAALENAPIFFATAFYPTEKIEYGWDFLRVQFNKQTYELDLPGIYQVQNLRTVLVAVHQLQLQGWQIPTQKLLPALSNTKKMNGLHGRWELLQTAPSVVVDVAHNEDGMRQLLLQLQMLRTQSLFKGQLHLVLGMVKDKAIDKVLRLLPKTAHYYFTQAQIPRALAADALQAAAAIENLHGKTYDNVNEAIAAAKVIAATDDLVLVCGSVFLVGEVEGIAH
jgi:dihydrofolate synthase / folylpolyglutamate synthase